MSGLVDAHAEVLIICQGVTGMFPDAVPRRFGGTTGAISAIRACEQIGPVLCRADVWTCSCR